MHIQGRSRVAEYPLAMDNAGGTYTANPETERGRNCLHWGGGGGGAYLVVLGDVEDPGQRSAEVPLPELGVVNPRKLQ